MKQHPAKPTIFTYLAAVGTYPYNMVMLRNLDVPKLLMTTFQELILISLLSVIGVFANLWYTIYLGQERTGSIAVPLTFIFMLIIGKVYETKTLQLVCSKLGIGYTGSSALYRVLQKVVILVIVLAVNLLPDAITDVVRSKDFQFKGNLELSRKSAVYVQAWYCLSTKLIGSYFVITFCRLYIDLVIYSYKLLTYVPPPSSDYSVEKKKLERDNNETAYGNDANGNSLRGVNSRRIANSREHFVIQ